MVLVLVAVILFIFLLDQHRRGCPVCVHLKIFNPEVIKHYVLGFGSWALIVFIGLYALNTVSLLPPIGIMSLAAGFIFGPWAGSVGIMIGSLIGTTATFTISRVFGRKYLETIIRGKGQEFEEKLNQKGFITILFIRLIPLIPWEVVNYASGLSKIKYRDYILGTLIGIFPSVVIQTYFADRLANFNLRDPKLLAAVFGFIFLITLPGIYLIVKKKMNNKNVSV